MGRPRPNGPLQLDGYVGPRVRWYESLSNKGVNEAVGTSLAQPWSTSTVSRCIAFPAYWARPDCALVRCQVMRYTRYSTLPPSLSRPSETKRLVVNHP